MDGRTIIPLTHRESIGNVLLQPGAIGLGEMPVDIATSVTPGVRGGVIDQVTSLMREITLPLAVWGTTDAAKWEAIQRLRDLVDPTQGMTPDGSFKLVAATPAGQREITVAYLSGLEGDDHGRVGNQRFVLQLVAPDPVAYDREERTLRFPLADGGPFLMRAEDDDDPVWGDLMLSPSAVVGEGISVQMGSGVEVWPVITMAGPVPDGGVISTDAGLNLEITRPVPAGSTLRIVTSPRGRSARLDGELAWSHISATSRFAPFARGSNILDVEIPNAAEPADIALHYTGGHRSLW